MAPKQFGADIAISEHEEVVLHTVFGKGPKCKDYTQFKKVIKGNLVDYPAMLLVWHARNNNVIKLATDNETATHPTGSSTSNCGAGKFMLHIMLLLFFEKGSSHVLLFFLVGYAASHCDHLDGDNELFSSPLHSGFFLLQRSSKLRLFFSFKKII